MGAHHPECPERLGAVNDHLLAKGLLDYMDACDAPLATREQLARAHSGFYLDEFAEIAQQVPEGGLVQIDPDTSINAYSYQAALRSAGAVVLAMDMVLGGKSPAAFCNIRPPGHHAERSNAGGFCFFNNVAVGIRHAVAVHGLERVALIDFDVHHGNGSEDILFNDEHVLMCSIFEKNLYPFCGDVPMGSNMINVGLPARSGGEAFRQAVEQQWIPALNAYQPQLIVISAGFDGHREDDMGNLGLVESDYEWVTRQIMKVANQHAQGRVVSCLEGGYALSALGRSAAAHVRVLIGAD
ncbi:histone deacetylase family protein [Undibacterium cyanobacteriorum]|uniref:Histone deacetylase family protein n=1 Tax=Undibacterium cyanobacteriorum TaxID=3073561 RepID=A0ABY9RMR6_9BURK|nr:histone deacetylase family protein [Undibacterium sp. 20NA77.5]WMW82493.1 histone deacetylase family protein [Undibacterium sp. 20NA77.5]